MKKKVKASKLKKAIQPVAKFYCFNQNNSGGYFESNEKIAEYVVIEAHSALEANRIAGGIGIYFNGCDTGIDCSCCGDRWCSVDEGDADPTPMVYGKPALTYKSDWTTKPVRIHYLDGSVVVGEGIDSSGPSDMSVDEGNPGITKREYFAALAMQGICSGRSPDDYYANGIRYDTVEIKNTCTVAVALADALIAELNKDETQEVKHD